MNTPSVEPVVSEIRVVQDGKPVRRVYPVSLVRLDPSNPAGKPEVLLPWKVDPHDSASVDAFLDEACKRYPSLDRELLRSNVWQLATPAAAPARAADGDDAYREEDGGLVWLRPTQSGPLPIRLTNFTARIVADVKKDDGDQVSHYFDIVASVRGKERRLSLPADEFEAMKWPIQQLGSGAIVYGGPQNRDHARTAIQVISEDVAEERICYTHTGWRNVGGQYVYLHGGGAIGEAGVVPGISVELPGNLKHYVLPDPPTGEELKQSIRASLKVMYLGGDVTAAAYPLPWRAVLPGGVDHSHHLAGGSGVFKSTFAGVLLQHFGPGMDEFNLPANWSSTDNFLENLAHSAKDTLLAIDEFKPTGSLTEQQRWHSKADRVLRAQGNGQGRGRLNDKAKAKPTRPPRGLILSTGEVVPHGHSLQGRMLVNTVSVNDIPKADLYLCKQDAAAGVYAKAMAGYLRWLAGLVGRVGLVFRQEMEELRNKTHIVGGHSRAAGIVASHAVGMKYFLRFAVEVEAITQAESEKAYKRGWDALMVIAGKNAGAQAAEEPAGKFLSLLQSALVSGRAHLGHPKKQGTPENPQFWGWRQQSAIWMPYGPVVGWVDAKYIYLNPEAAFKAANDSAGPGESMDIGEMDVWRRLRDKGLLVPEQCRPDQLKARETIQGKRQHVIRLKLSALHEDANQPDQPDQPDQSVGDIEKSISSSEDVTADSSYGGQISQTKSAGQCHVRQAKVRV